MNFEEIDQVDRDRSLTFLFGLQNQEKFLMAILEVLYSTGKRRMEFCHLKLRDLDVGRGLVMIRAISIRCWDMPAWIHYAIYTRMAATKLKKVHNRTHPGAALKQEKSETNDTDINKIGEPDRKKSQAIEMATLFFSRYVRAQQALH